jgi:uncharacterized protein (TIGR00266 family)
MSEDKNHDIQYRLHGSDIQMVEAILDPGEAVIADTSSMICMDGNIAMNTGMGGQGLFSGFKRMFTGEDFFITEFSNEGSEKQGITLSASMPGKVMPFDLSEIGGEIICQKDAFLGAAADSQLEIHFNKKMGVGFFGGEGFILQKLTGKNHCFIHAGGSVIKRELKSGEVIKTDTGALVAMTTDVSFDIEYVGGIINPIFGGEGAFINKMEGPGTVYLQSIPFSHLADKIIREVNYRGNENE